MPFDIVFTADVEGEAIHPATMTEEERQFLEGSK